MEIDIFGQAALAHYNNQDLTPIKVHAIDFEDDKIPVEYLFRSYPKMPLIEQKALDLSYGKILDVGCGVGSHIDFLKQEGYETIGIDTSEGCIEVCQQRGLEKTLVSDFFTYESEEKFDTILFLMNGAGIIGDISQIKPFFMKLHDLLKSDGRILIDSSDLRYLFDYEIEDTNIWDMDNYYGEMKYQISYKELQSDWFNWLYLDFKTLQQYANHYGFECDLVVDGEHFDYLAKLTISS